VVAVQRPGEPDLERLSLVVTRQQQDLARTRELVEHTLILERAKGVLIERLGCSPTEATDHLTHLAVHGFLHLVGYDHESDADAETMEQLERDILARLNVPDPYLAPISAEATGV